jgi:hypothetical protein
MKMIAKTRRSNCTGLLTYKKTAMMMATILINKAVNVDSIFFQFNDIISAGHDSCGS